MKKIIFLMLFALIGWQHTQAQSFYTGGLYYNITSPTTVEVAGRDNDLYFVDVSIPQSVIYLSYEFGYDYFYNPDTGEYESQYYSYYVGDGQSYTVTSIGDYAFQYSPMQSLVLPNTITSIGFASFNYCTNLHQINLPQGLSIISDYAFSACSGLNSVTCNASAPITISANVFEGVNQGDCSLTVPNASVSDYQAANVWQNFIPINNIYPPVGPASSLHFSSNQNTVDLGQSLGNFGTGDFAIEMKVRTSGYTDGNMYLLSKRSFCGGDNFLNLSISSQGKINVETSNFSVSSSSFTGNVYISDNMWHHIALTRTGGYLKLYVDGALDSASSTNFAVDLNNNYNLVLGGYTPCTPYNNNQYFNGRLDEVRFWNRSLPQTEIQNSKNCEIQTTGNGLLANYHFNQGNSNDNNAAVTSLIDSSGNNNNGALLVFGLTGASSNWSNDAGVPSGVACETVTIITPTFAAVAPLCSGAPLADLPTSSIEGIRGTWSPVMNNLATTLYTFTPSAGQSATTATLTITVNPIVTPTFTAVAPICSGATLADLPTTANNVATGPWSPPLPNSATTTNNAVTGTWWPALNNLATTTYTFTPNVGQCANTTTLTITVNPQETPAFTAVAPICSGATLAALPTLSNNAVTGTWSPALNNLATTTYTFTPSVGQCANTTTLTITVSLTPAFTAVAPICSGASAAELPTTSLNGIIGTWSPAMNNLETTTYTFTRNDGLCGTANMEVIVNAPVTPQFNQIGSVCAADYYEVLNQLPNTSLNGIVGTWQQVNNYWNWWDYLYSNDAVFLFTPSTGQCAINVEMGIRVQIKEYPYFDFGYSLHICQGSNFWLQTISSNNIEGSWSPPFDISYTGTRDYTFIPYSGECANVTTISITVDPLMYVSPYWNVLPNPYCPGATVYLPTTSPEGITGTWSPSSTIQNVEWYSFTPNAGQGCVSTDAVYFYLPPTVEPFLYFDQIAPICQGGTLVLPSISQNEYYLGSWFPAVNNNETTTYTFTTYFPLMCQSNFYQMTVEVYPATTPTFNEVAPISLGSFLASLPTTSNEGIAGSWSPAVNNLTTTTYTFTPEAGLCATTAAITIIVNPLVTPTFDQVEAVCFGESLSALPTISLNGITGIWAPEWNNTATTTYIFLPNEGQFATTATMTITVNPKVTPTFSLIAPICSGEFLAALPTTSNKDDITGTWSPALVNLATTTYTFTPNAGQCATTALMTIKVNPIVTPIFTQVAPICAGGFLPPLPTVSNNVIGGTWSPALNNLVTTTYTFTPYEKNPCASPVTMTIVVRTAGTIAGGNVTVCSSGTALNANGYSTQFTNSTALVLNGNPAGSTIQWQRSFNFVNATSATPSWSTVVNATAANNSALINGNTLTVSNLTTTIWYRARVTNGTCVTFTDPVKITISPLAKAGAVTNVSSVCAGGSIIFTSAVFTGGSIAWEVSTTSGTAGFSTVAGESGLTFTMNNAPSSTFYVRSVVTSGGCSIARSAVKTIIVSPLSVGGTITGGGTVCSGSNKSLKIAGCKGAIQWMYSTDGTNFINVPIGGAVAPTFVATSTSGTASSYSINNITGTAFFKAVVKSGLCSSAESNVVVFNTATTASQVDLSVESAQVCSGSATSLYLPLFVGDVKIQKSINWTSARPTWTTVTLKMTQTLYNGQYGAFSTGALTQTTAYRAVSSIGNCAPVVYGSIAVIGVNECTFTREIETAVAIKTPFEVIAYPNPSNNVFNFKVNGANDATVSILVFDMTGRQVDNEVVKSTDIENISLGQNYSSGVYNVIVSQGMNTKTVRLVKN